VPSDFQDYSLVTLVGVAAHLMHVSDDTKRFQQQQLLCLSAIKHLFQLSALRQYHGTNRSANASNELFCRLLGETVHTGGSTQQAASCSCHPCVLSLMLGDMLTALQLTCLC